MRELRDKGAVCTEMKRNYLENTGEDIWADHTDTAHFVWQKGDVEIEKA